MLKRLAFIFFCLSVSGCGSNIKPYSSSAEANLFINIKTDPDIKTSIDIYYLGNNCKLSYRGTVNLENSKQSIGLKINQVQYLVVSFFSSSFWAGRSSSMSQEITLNPSADNQYIMNVSYLDNIYNVDIKKRNRRSKRLVEIDINSVTHCSN